jgi:hypothetical protein
VHRARTLEVLRHCCIIGKTGVVNCDVGVVHGEPHNGVPVVMAVKTTDYLVTASTEWPRMQDLM